MLKTSSLLTALMLTMTVAAPPVANVSWAKSSGFDREAMDSAVAKVKPSLVRIQVVEPEYYNGREVKGISFGSGTIFHEDGYVVTNHHVAGKSVQLICTLSNREEVPAILIGTDPQTDIAVIKLLPEKPTKWPVAKFGDSDKVEVGDPVLALGSPQSLSQSVTLGIISNTAMIIPAIYGDRGMELDGENVGELVRWFGHDAAIYGGNSGGPLIDMKGNIIGVNELSFGLAGAIPGNLAKRVAYQIMEKKSVRRAYSGVGFAPLLKSEGGKDGILVATVYKDSPAEKAGILPGDVIMSIGGTAVTGRFKEDIPLVNNVVADLPIGKPAAFVIQRGTEKKSFDVTTSERQPAFIEAVELREWGMTARNLSIWTQLDLARNSAKGVLVDSLRSGGPASKAKPELKEGDIITRVGDETITNIDDLRAATSKALAGKTGLASVLVTLEREGQNLLAVAEVGIEKQPDPPKQAQKAALPVETQVITEEIANALAIPGTKGVRVTRVYKGTPAGFPFEEGDLITHLDGEQIEASKPVDQEVFDLLLRQYKPGTEAEFRVIRKGEVKEVKWKLDASPAKPREMARYEDVDFEFIVRDAAFVDRQKPGFEGTNVSVVADSVTAGGWAYVAGMRVGDGILAIDGKPIASKGDVEKVMAEIRKTKPRSVVFYVRRGSQTTYLEIEPNWK